MNLFAAASATSHALFAVADAGQQLTTRHFARLEQFNDPRMLWGLVAGVGTLLAGFVIWQYRRESGALSTPMAALLATLRLTALGAAILFYLEPEKRTDREVVEQSRAVVLVDVSQSMSVEDQADQQGASMQRNEAVFRALSESSLLEQLRAEHDTSIVAFDASTHRLAQWPRQIQPQQPATGGRAQAGDDKRPSTPADSTGDPAAARSPDLTEAGGNAWLAQLAPNGNETRLGDALASIMADGSGGPLAGIVVMTDGRQTSGLDPIDAANIAEEKKIPLFAVGVGSTQPRRNVRVQELIAPQRAYPDDKTMVRAIVFAEGMLGRSADVELYVREIQGDAVAAETLVARKEAQFSSDPHTVTLEFEFEPAAAGRLALEARIDAPTDDQFSNDNARREEMEIVEANSRVLLLANAATRDYRFLRNQLRRDRHSAVDVLLQTSPQGISQDADSILHDFPSLDDELFEYDCIVAFDFDWTQLDAQQAEMLERWVSEEAGGLIVTAGPVHTSALSQSAEHAKIRSLYPVTFQRRLTLLDDGVYGSKTPWPIAFSPEGEDAQFLQIEDSRELSAAAWAEFPGVYGCYAVKGPKPGARVLGRYSDPDAGISAERPIYFAEHFYGAGRVFYMGSGELWRLRSRDLKYFEVLYTQLIRHVSQGRLLRGSSSGYLLIERDRYSTGDTVSVRAQLKSSSREPLVAPRVTARVIGPDGLGRNVELLADSAKAGSFQGQFTAQAEGSYSIELTPPDAIDERLVRRIEVSPPDLEFRQTSQDQLTLAELARISSGIYYKNLSSALDGGDGVQPVASLIKSRAETRLQRGKPDAEFAEQLRKTLMIVICAALSCEWFLRRLMKLA